MRGDETRREYSVCSAAFSANSFDRSVFAESRRRFNWRTPTFTNTTPASRIPPIAIQRIPPRARARLAPARAFGRGRERGTATAVCAWVRLAIALLPSNLRADAEARGLCARIAGDLGRGRP